MGIRDDSEAIKIRTAGLVQLSRNDDTAQQATQYNASETAQQTLERHLAWFTSAARDGGIVGGIAATTVDACLVAPYARRIPDQFLQVAEKVHLIPHIKF